MEWRKASKSQDSYAIPIDEGKWDVGMVVVIINSGEKYVSSREGMKVTMETSPFYKAWVESAEKDLKEIKEGIKNRDLEKVGVITERNALKMHATMLGANPPIFYWEKESLEAMEMVKKLRTEGIPCYFTMDAGPNVKILCPLSRGEEIRERLKEVFREEQIIITGVGPGIQIL